MHWSTRRQTLRWLAHAPRQRWRRWLAGRLPVGTAALHPSVDLIGTGQWHVGVGASVGRHSVLATSAGGSLHIGDGAWIGHDCEIDAAPCVRIGARTSLQHRSQVLGDVSMGAGCVCAANLYISSGQHRFADVPWLPVRVQDGLARQPGRPQQTTAVSIGDDCWFGIHVVVLPGVSIGRGCVIGAHAVVRHDLPPYSIAVGAPARVVGARLLFQPPEAISAAQDEHIPYFYAGLRQLPDSASDDTRCPRVREGWPAGPSFTLAVAVSPGQQLALELHALCHGQLKHAGQALAVQPGPQRVTLAVQPGRWGLIDFEWQAHQRGNRDGLVVLAARAGARLDRALP